MASAGKTSKSRKAAQTPSPAPEPVPPPIEVPVQPRSRWRSGTVLTAFFFLVVAGLAIVLQRFVPDLRDRPEYQFQMAESRITPPHEWVPQDLLQEMLTTHQLPETVSLLDPELCRNVAAAWEKHPWVKRVISVRITPEPALIVELEYRRPAAFIRVVQGFYPIDLQGVLLPPRDFSMSAIETLPIVKNVASTPQGGAGESWGDPVVEAAARLAATLAPEQNLNLYWSKFQIKAIIAPTVKEVPVAPDQLVFELETAGGNLVVWGKAPGFDTLEPAADVKLARLAEYQSRFGSLDGVSGLHRIDIRLLDGISLQPLNETLYR